MNQADIIQAGIVLCSATAAWLVNSPGRRARGIGAVVGLCGQPLWFVAAWQAGQWGVLALSAWYTLAWARGVWHWLGPAEVSQQGPAAAGADLGQGCGDGAGCRRSDGAGVMVAP